MITKVHNNSTPVAYKNCTPITTCITKHNRTTKDDVEELDLVVQM